MARGVSRVMTLVIVIAIAIIALILFWGFFFGGFNTLQNIVNNLFEGL